MEGRESNIDYKKTFPFFLVYLLWFNSAFSDGIDANDSDTVTGDNLVGEVAVTV